MSADMAGLLWVASQFRFGLVSVLTKRAMADAARNSDRPNWVITGVQLCRQPALGRRAITSD
jgi:hypothetical protein